MTEIQLLLCSYYKSTEQSVSQTISLIISLSNVQNNKPWKWI